jgi:mRNA interferase MazF
MCCFSAIALGQNETDLLAKYEQDLEAVLSPKAFNERTGIVIGLPMTTAAFNETNPFAVKFIGPKRKASYILGHQPKSFDWRAREAKPHPWKQIPEDVFTLACETPNQIISIGN